MTSTDPRVRSLLRQARRVEEAGKRAAAAELYRQIVTEAPDTAVAWAGLGRVVVEAEEAEEAFQKALELDAESVEARVGLAQLRGEPVPEAWRQALAPEPEPEPEPEPGPVVAEKEDEHAYTYTCYRHPNRTTSLRCYNCGKAICVSCTNKTSVGYLCPECVRNLEDKYYNARPLDYLIALVVSLPLSLIAGYLVWRFGGGFLIIFLMIFAGGVIGGLIGRVTKRAIGGRRGRYLPHLVVAMMAVGVFLPVAPFLLSGLGGGLSLFSLLAPGVYLFVAGGSAFYWMK